MKDGKFSKIKELLKKTYNNVTEDISPEKQEKLDKKKKKRQSIYLNPENELKKHLSDKKIVKK